MNTHAIRFLRAALLFQALGLAACGPHHNPHAPAKAFPSANVAVETAAVSSVGAREEIIGTVRPLLSAAVSAKVSGAVAEVAVVAGAEVKTGALLARIDAREIQARVDQAEAAALAGRQERERAERLAATKASSQKELDAAIARSDAAEGALVEAKTMLDYTRVAAPFDGVVVRKLCDVGDLAQPGRVLFELEDPRTLRLEVEAPEQLGGLVAVGDVLPVKIDAAGFKGEGIVQEIEPAIRGASRTFLTRIALPQDERLRSGQFGRATLKLPSEGGVWIPETAIVARGQLELVFVVAEGKAHMRIVRTGRREGGKAEVLAGLDAGDKVIVDHAARLMDGQPVTLQ